MVSGRVMGLVKKCQEMSEGINRIRIFESTVDSRKQACDNLAGSNILSIPNRMRVTTTNITRTVEAGNKVIRKWLSAINLSYSEYLRTNIESS